MVIEFVTNRIYKSHELAQASLLLGTVPQVSDVAHGPLVSIVPFFYRVNHGSNAIKMFKNFNCFGKLP